MLTFKTNMIREEYSVDIDFDEASKAWMINKDYTKKQAYYEVLRALYETQEK